MKVKRIYVAEDQPDLAEMVQLMLQTEGGHQVRVFDNGLDAYREVLRQAPDLLIVDILLPQLNGLAVVRLLKYHQEYRDLPVLVMSSITDPDIAERAQRMGASAFLPKPFETPALLARVRELLSAKGTADPAHDI